MYGYNNYNQQPYYYNQPQPNYNNGYQQQNTQVQQQPQQQAQPNMNFIPMYFVSSEEDIKKYIVMPNQIAYFKDINSNMLYEKKADNFSNYTTKKYEMTDLSAPHQNNSQYALKSEIQALEAKLNELYQKVGLNNANEQQ